MPEGSRRDRRLSRGRSSAESCSYRLRLPTQPLEVLRSPSPVGRGGQGVRTCPVIQPSWLSLYEVTLELVDDRCLLRLAASRFVPHDLESLVRRWVDALIVIEPGPGCG